MKNIVKRTSALLCVLVLISSMLVMPASAKAGDDWDFRWTSNNQTSRSVSGARWGSWKTVTFKFKGTGIQRVTASPSTYAEYRGLRVYEWNAPPAWCCGEVQVRSTWGRSGNVVVYILGSSAKAISVNI